MPIIVALDVSLSMTRSYCDNSDLKGTNTYHNLAVEGIYQLLIYLTNNCKLEFVSLVIYSTHSEVIVDFTRDYECIRQALRKVKHYDKINFEIVLQTVSKLLATNWAQNHCHVLVFTDCGVGFGNTSVKNVSSNMAAISSSGGSWLKFLSLSKLSFICIGSVNDTYFNQTTHIYQQFLDNTGLNGDVFKAVSTDTSYGQTTGDINRETMTELINTMCKINFKPFEAILKCGAYFKLECPISIWPQPMPYVAKDKFGNDFIRSISRRFEICGFVPLCDIGSPVSISRHLIVPMMDTERCNKKEKKSKFHKTEPPANEYEKLENEIISFYSKGEGNNSEDEGGKVSVCDSHKESICVLLHGALKVENMAALVVLNDNWFGFVYSYADSKKKSNLMLNVLPPGNSVIPWLGDLSFLRMKEDLLNENTNFPVKSEKRSYSQNCVVWIKNAGLQSDIQKALRHAKKLPEKTPHFYKELNRIRRAALSLGFVELLDTLACIFERESTALPSNASPDCSIQLKHSSNELRKVSNWDLKNHIIALPTKYNKL